MNDKMLSIIKDALKEDGIENDVTTLALVKSKQELIGRFIAKASGVVSGIDVAKEVFRTVNPKIVFEIWKENGSYVARGDVIALVNGPMADILRGERVALNFLQRMSGIATMTDKFVKELAGTNCQILDTRKTTPLLRYFERQAVRDGGGVNHRYNLSDRVLIKDNHLAAVGNLPRAVRMAKQYLVEHNKNDLLIEVEVESKEEFLEALTTECDIIMLDNMTDEQMKELVDINQGLKKIEASGNMSLTRVRSVALIGVDYISVGLLTHSVKAMDISLKFFKKQSV